MSVTSTLLGQTARIKPMFNMNCFSTHSDHSLGYKTQRRGPQASQFVAGQPSPLPNSCGPTGGTLVGSSAAKLGARPRISKNQTPDEAFLGEASWDHPEYLGRMVGRTTETVEALGPVYCDLAFPAPGLIAKQKAWLCNNAKTHRS